MRVHCPLFWRFYSVSHLCEALLQFREQPPAPPQEVTEEGTFKEEEERKAQQEAAKPVFVNWKKSLVYFLLLESPVLKQSDIEEMK